MYQNPDALPYLYLVHCLPLSNKDAAKLSAPVLHTRSLTYWIQWYDKTREKLRGLGTVGGVQNEEHGAQAGGDGVEK